MLSASEISDAVSILKKSNKDHEDSSFSYISLSEPDKKLLKEKTDSERIVRIVGVCLLYTSPSPRDLSTSRMPSSA